MTPSHYLSQCWNTVNWILRTNFSEILIGIQIFSFKKIHLKMSSGKWRPSCLSLNVLKNLSMCYASQPSVSCIIWYPAAQLPQMRSKIAALTHCGLGDFNHGSHRPGKVMEFNPWLEKSLNFMLTWKNGILPGKVIENQWKSLKKFMRHVKLNLNLKIMMIVWFKVSVCHHIWDQIGETMLGTFLAELLVTLLQVAASLVTLYQLSPVKQHLQRKH